MEPATHPTMRAVVLERFGAPLRVSRRPEPTAGTGEVLVRVAAAPVAHYAREVFDGTRRYPLPTPVIPGLGGIGQVLRAGPDATRLAPGDWVFLDPTVRSRDDAIDPDIVLQGWSARGEGGAKLQRHFLHGSYAERAMLPTENAIPLGPLDPADAPRWCALGVAAIPYGGLLAGALRPGETLLVSGATGNLGSAAVAVAFAMGAARVVAPGRDRTVLDDLRRRFGERLRPVPLSGSGADGQAMRDAADGPIDVVLDLLPPQAPAAAARAAAMTVRRGGRVVLMGGVGMLGGEDLALPYPWIMRNDVSVRGRWMYDPAAITTLAAMIRAGTLDLDRWEITPFPLEEAEQAVAHAATHAGPFRLTVLAP